MSCSRRFSNTDAARLLSSQWDDPVLAPLPAPDTRCSFHRQPPPPLPSQISSSFAVDVPISACARHLSSLRAASHGFVSDVVRDAARLVNPPIVAASSRRRLRTTRCPSAQVVYKRGLAVVVVHLKQSLSPLRSSCFPDNLPFPFLYSFSFPCLLSYRLFLKSSSVVLSLSLSLHVYLSWVYGSSFSSPLSSRLLLQALVGHCSLARSFDTSRFNQDPLHFLASRRYSPRHPAGITLLLQARLHENKQPFLIRYSVDSTSSSQSTFTTVPNRNRLLPRPTPLSHPRQVTTSP